MENVKNNKFLHLIVHTTVILMELNVSVTKSSFKLSLVSVESAHPTCSGTVASVNIINNVGKGMCGAKKLFAASPKLLSVNKMLDGMAMRANASQASST